MWYNISVIRKGESQKKGIKTMKILNVVNVIMIAVMAWMFFSWVDVVSDNNTAEPQHSDLNCFVMFTEEDK